MKNFYKLWLGELISSIGSGMTAFALSVYVYKKTGSVSYVSLITLLSFMPSIVLSPIGGLLADRYDRRLLMIIGDLFSGLGLVYILWSIQAGEKSIVPIFVGITFSSIFTSLLEPSYRATLTDILEEENYAKASGLIQVAGSAKYLISPVIAGMILSVADIRVILLLDILTFITTCLMIFLVRKSMNSETQNYKKDSFKGLLEGLFIIKENRGVYFLVIIMFFVCFFMGFIQILIRPMILALSSVKTAGIMESLCAVGLLIGSLWIGIAGIKKNYSKILAVACFFCGIFMSMTGVNENLNIIGISTFLFFSTLPFMNSCADVLVRVSIPNELQGRVWGLISLITQMGTVVAYIISGVMADYVFEPMFNKNGILVENIGIIIGTGKGRGIGFMLILSGIGMLIMAIVIWKNGEIREVSEKCVDLKFK
jgi:MFS transporter